jgi:hypothetical protein
VDVLAQACNPSTLEAEAGGWRVEASLDHIWLQKIFLVFVVGFSEDPVSSWAPVAHACNPSYSEGRDQEDRHLKPSLGK